MSIEEELDIIYFKILCKDEIYKYIANKHNTYHDHIIIENYPEDISSITDQIIKLQVIEVINLIKDNTTIGQFFNEIKKRQLSIRDNDIVALYFFKHDKSSETFQQESEFIDYNFVIQNYFNEINVENTDTDIEYVKNWNPVISNISDFSDKLSLADIELFYDEKDYIIDTNDKVVSTSSVQIYAGYTINTEIELSLHSFFNLLHTHKMIPFINFGNYYKIHKSLEISHDWKDVEAHDDRITIKIFNQQLLTKPTIDYTNYNNYIDTYVSLNDGKIVISSDIDGEQAEATKQQIEKLFTNDIKMPNYERNLTTGIFYFPNMSYDKKIFNDMVMNDRVFSSIISIDEINKSHKNKTQLYIVYSDPLINEKFTITINNKLYDRKDLKMKQFADDGLFTNQMSYISISYKQFPTNIVESFRNIMTRLIIMYQEMYESYQIPYLQLLELSKQIKTNELFNIQVESEIAKNDKKVNEIKIKEGELNIIDQDKGIQNKLNSSRMCQKKAKPVEVTLDSDLSEYKENEDYVVYPHEYDTENMYYSKRHVFLCDPETRKKIIGEDISDEKKYAGYYHNKKHTENGIPPYIPCCYSKPDWKRDDYIKSIQPEDETIDKEIVESSILTTHISVGRSVQNNGVTAIFNSKWWPNLIKIFKSIDIKFKNPVEYYRRGMVNSNSSIIHCFEYALNDYNIIDENDTKKFINDKRLEIFKDIDYSIVKQENYDKTVEEIEEEVLNLKNEFDAKLYIAALQEYYKCNLFIFKKNSTDTDTLAIPPYKDFYCKYINQYDKTIFVLEHDNSQYELIEFKFSKTKYAQYVKECQFYNNKNEIVIKEGTKHFMKELNNMFYQLIKNGVDRENQLIDYNIVKNINSISQYIDNKGKIRFLKYNHAFKIKGKTTPRIKQIIIETIPLPPLNLPINNYDECIEFNKEKKYIKFLLKDVNVSKIMTGMNTKPLDKNSKLTDYKKYSKMSNIFVQLLLWKFSNYIGDDEITNDTIPNFIKQQVKIINNFVDKIDTDNFPYLLSIDNMFFEGNKMLIDENMKEKVVYILNFNIKTNLQATRKYKDKKEIENLYNTMDDFKKYNTEYLVDQKSLVKLITK